MEQQAIAEGVKENGLEDSDKVIRAVQAERHAQELRDLDKQFAAEKKIMVDDALSQLAERYEPLREEKMRHHEAELAALQVKTWNFCGQKSGMHKAWPRVTEFHLSLTGNLNITTKGL